MRTHQDDGKGEGGCSLAEESEKRGILHFFTGMADQQDRQDRQQLAALCFFDERAEGPPDGVHGGAIFSAFHQVFATAMVTERGTDTEISRQEPLLELPALPLRSLRVQFRALTPIGRALVLETEREGGGGHGGGSTTTGGSGVEQVGPVVRKGLLRDAETGLVCAVAEAVDAWQ